MAQPFMNTQRIAKLFISAVVIAAALQFGAASDFYNSALVSAFFGFALFSVALFTCGFFRTFSMQSESLLSQQFSRRSISSFSITRRD